MSAPRVVLTMIVKDEAHVIVRCIESVRPLIDAYCIVDTGSSDGTQDLIRRTLADLEGVVHESPWVDFATNRTQALDRARSLGSHSLMIDADDTLEPEPGLDLRKFRRSLDNVDVLDVRIKTRGLLDYMRPQVTSTRLPFRYRGVLHEYLEIPDGAKRGGLAAGFWIECRPGEGNRSRPSDKFERDARLLEDAIASETDEGLRRRYTFYLGQSWRDAGQPESALAAYEARTAMGGWSEEVAVAHVEAGHLAGRLGRPFEQVLDHYLRAYDACPTRAEGLCHAATAARLAGRMPTAFLMASRGLSITRPTIGLFVEPAVYVWKLAYEASIAAYYVGELDLGRRLTTELLANPELPEAERKAVIANKAFYKR